MSVPTPDPQPTVHVPVLMDEVLEWAQVERASIMVDGTLGGGGHSLAMLSRMPARSLLIGIDRDPAAIQRTSPRFADQTDRVRFACQSYVELPSILAAFELGQVDGILLDLGLSSDQLEDRERGFSFRQDAPLDLRFDPNSGPTAADLLAKMAEEKLADIIYQYGEERFSRRIARAIVERRRRDPIETTRQLYELIHANVRGQKHGRVDAATRTFQALRIAVNEELRHLEKALEVLPDCLRPGGRILIISFHSLEDRIVKNAFRSDARLENLTKKPIIGQPEEVFNNPRARSAKLRVAQRV